MSISRRAIVVGIVSFLLGSRYSGYISISSGNPGSSLVDAESESNSERWACRPFLPNVHTHLPPSSSHPAIQTAVGNVEEFFSRRFSKGDIDSLSVAIVTSGGALYERNFGIMRGNETTTSPLTHSHSMYRIASVSKLFTALEGLILAEKGVISWYVSLYYIEYVSHHTDCGAFKGRSCREIHQRVPISAGWLGSQQALYHTQCHTHCIVPARDAYLRSGKRLAAWDSLGLA